MESGDEAEKIRREDDEWADREARREEPGATGAQVLVGTTTTITSYPTAAQRFFGMKATTVFGAQVEGGAGTLAPKGKTFRALNLGSAVPPAGSAQICTFVDNRWVFRYDG